MIYLSKIYDVYNNPVAVEAKLCSTALHRGIIHDAAVSHYNLTFIIKFTEWYESF